MDMVYTWSVNFIWGKSGDRAPIWNLLTIYKPYNDYILPTEKSKQNN